MNYVAGYRGIENTGFIGVRDQGHRDRAGIEQAAVGTEITWSVSPVS